LAVAYGVKSSKNFKLAFDEAKGSDGKITSAAGKEKVRELFLSILVKEIRRTYKVPMQVS
jgi:hypothetical protein